MLQIGKHNNVVAWNLEMRASVGAVYGNVANFLTTNERFVPPVPREEDFTELDLFGEEKLPVAPISTVLLADMVGAERRRIEQQTIDEATIWTVMWLRMTRASQNKVMEEPGYEVAFNGKDCVILWELIRRTHLTHTYSARDQIMMLNRHDQELRYHALRQGDRELVHPFKARFDAQIEMNRAVGVPDMDEPRMAMDFLHKLDLRRHSSMLEDMRHNALLGRPNAYPVTLASALSIASRWLTHCTTDHSDVTADSIMVRVTKSRDQDREKRIVTITGGKTPSGKKKSPAAVTCYVCGEKGHYTRDCRLRKWASSTE